MPTKDINKRREQWRSWYLKNKNNPVHKKRVRDFDKQRRKDLVEWFDNLKKGLSCLKCCFDHPAALDFHHRNPDEKLYEVSSMPYQSISKAKIIEEIAKCDVLCSNCHRILHYDMKNGSVV